MMNKTTLMITTILIIIMVLIIQSCDQHSKTEEQNKTLIIKANDELFNKGNLDFANEVFTTDYAGGPEFIKEFVQTRRRAFPDLQIKLEPVVAEGETVAWLRTNTGTLHHDYLGYKPSGKKVTWKEIVFTRLNEQGKVAEEWYVSELPEIMQAASGIEGVYEYLPPVKGRGIIKNGYFNFMFGPLDGSGPMTSNSGTHTFSSDTVKCITTHSTDVKQTGAIWQWRVKSWSSDTVAFEVMNDKGQITSTGRAVRVSK
jgi:predicted ester cyclase